jgi:FkbM family methyltransferase
MRQVARAYVDVVVRHRIGPVIFGVPIGRVPWDQHDLENYESIAIGRMCQAMLGYDAVMLFDCGADIGIFTSAMCSRSDRLKGAIVFEPSPSVTEILAWNMSQLPIETRVIGKAVSCFEGRGSLQRPAYDAEDEARFLVAGDGPVEVTTVDACGIRGGDVAIKIDVEGGELDVLKGAAETIAAARSCAVTIEAHPLVAARIGRDPVECLRFLESIRPFAFLIAETGEPVSTSGPVLRDGQTAVWNIIGRSIEP